MFNSSLSDFAVLVFGQKRDRALHHVLEGLQRQGALSHTQVWLDGHHEDQALMPAVNACQELEARFPEARWFKNGSRVGIAKMVIGALHKVVETHEQIIVLEDDCFPAPEAVQVFRETLERTKVEPEILTIYGHHFTDSEHEGDSTAFQCWGWATTASKLKPILAELRNLWLMTEYDFIVWIQERMTSEIKDSMDLYPGRSDSEIISRRFCWDSTLSFLAAQRHMLHRPTPRQVVFNFGMGERSGHFSRADLRFTKPPYRIVPEAEIVQRFDLSWKFADAIETVQTGQQYSFEANGQGQVFLGNGWSQSESWGTWSSADSCDLRLRLEQTDAEWLDILFDLRCFAPDLQPPLKVELALNGERVGDWLFEPSEWETQRSIRLPTVKLSDSDPAHLSFAFNRTVSPSALGASSDARHLAIGLLKMQVCDGFHPADNRPLVLSTSRIPSGD